MATYNIASVEEIHQKYQLHLQKTPEFKKPIRPEDLERWRGFLVEIAEGNATPKPKSVSNSFFLKIARALQAQGDLTEAQTLAIENHFRVVRGKSHSGVLVITVFTSPTPTYTDPETGEIRTQKFSCAYNCYYCPNQPGQPRSYLEGEPGVLRANQHQFDPVAQMLGRMEDLYNMGHPVDKLEVLILGGTWESYPEPYRESFIRDLYYAANHWGNPYPPKKSDLDSERNRNRNAGCHIIGITIETRPDTVSPEALALLRRYGCTRVQIGVQHLDDGVLRKIHRGCTRADVVRAIALLKSWGFKIDTHYMPNLPGATPALDRWMLLDQLLACGPIQSRDVAGFGRAWTRCPDEWTVWPVSHPELQSDQWKVYPCETTPYTVIEKWFREGTYVPYSETDLIPILLDMKAAVFPWIRLNRIVRDIPSDYIIASGDRPNLRQDLLVALKKRGQVCRCIRCREVKQAKFSEETCRYVVREYPSYPVGSTEYFISCEGAGGSILHGFVRLRLPAPDERSPHPAFQQHAWIRELHVYGMLQTTRSPCETSETTATVSQHRGIGKTLMGMAEDIAFGIHSRTQLLVIAGEGTKAYYGKLGYKETHYGYMEKNDGVLRVS
jgi:histone acetyltransferase (RNA polymerase elongator complex component)